MSTTALRPEAPALDAPADVIALLHDAMRRLGLPDGESAAAARSGSVTLDDIPIGLACDIDGETILAAADLGEGVLKTPDQRRIALRANTELMTLVGAAVACDRGQPRLLARYRITGREGRQFAAWLHEFARLAAAIREAQRSTLTPAA